MSLGPTFRMMARNARPWLSRKHSAHRILTGPLRGARIVASWHDYPAGITGATERALLAWLCEHVKEGTTWLDVGAHYGYTALALSRLVQARGRVFAFEPMLATAGCMAQTRVLNQLDQLTVVPKGLGCPDTLVLAQLPTTRGMADLTLVPSAKTSCDTIEVARFDWLWPLINGGDSTVHGIKIDVQGMELEVVEGMRATLTEQRPLLVVELHRGVSRIGFVNLLRDIGYSPIATPVEPLPDELTPLLLDDRSYAFLPA